MCIAHVCSTALFDLVCKIQQACPETVIGKTLQPHHANTPLHCLVQPTTHLKPAQKKKGGVSWVQRHLTTQLSVKVM